MPDRGLTLRASALGVIGVVFINLWVTYAENVVHSSRLNLSYFQITLLAVLMALVGGVNPLLGWAERRTGGRYRWMTPLSHGEFLVVVAVGIVGAVVPTSGVTGFLLGVIASPFYFASPENGWADYYHPHLSSWLVPTDQEALREFFEGGGRIDWAAWAVPLVWWAALVVAIVWATACAVVLLRRQWTEHEKLVYPLAAVAVEMTEGVEGRLPEFTRGRLFWGGAIFAFLLFAWNAVSWFIPAFPGVSALPYAGYYRVLTYSPGIYIQPFQFLTIGFAYFANTEVLLSVWFFFLLHMVEGGIFNRIGYEIGASVDSFSADPATEAWQGFGALAFMVAWRLWVARRHLRDVFRRAWRGQGGADDADEMLSYRTAVLGLACGTAFVLFWFWRSGMDAGSALLFGLALGIVYLGMARVVSETGVAYGQATVTPQAFVMDLRGTRALTGGALTSIALSYALIDYMRGLFAPGLAQAVKMGDSIRGNRRTLLFVITLGVLAGLVSSAWYTLHLGYTHGAYNCSPLFFNGDPKAVFSSTLAQMKSPRSPDPERLLFFGIGAALMGGLTFLRYRFPAWPIHPVGLTMAAGDNAASLVMPVFIAWACKATLMRVGGVALYRRSKPLFLGLLTGYTAGVTVSFVVDMIWFNGQGHMVHWW